jgi:predicted nucleotidyltransferase
LDRTREVRELTKRVATWARERSDVRAAALVGSWARGDARPDSDVDVVLLTTTPEAYMGGTPWPDAELVQTRDWGGLTERRLRLPSGLELELGVAPPEWASTDPLDPGTRAVVSDGMRILHDPDQLLAKLAAAC